jgi:molybdopterin molybdotransferase
MTGAPIPLGADSVIPVEFAQEENNVLKVVEAIPPGKNVGRIGEDIKIGQEVLDAGRKLRPQDIGILSSIGISYVSVIKKPSVDIFITGDELLKPGCMPEGYRIVDSNSLMLDALVFRDIQIHPNIVFLKDQREIIRDALSNSNADFILISGGSSVGQEDYAPSLVKELGEILIHGVALRPASPAGMGVINDKYVFLIPGNPVSCLCAYDLFASRAIRKSAGINYELPYKSAVLNLSSKISSMVGRMDYVRVKIVEGCAEPLAISGASMLSTTTIADGFLLVPGECEGYPTGENVKIYLYD